MIDQLIFPEESQLLMEPYLRTIEAGADLSIENDAKNKEAAPEGTSTGSDFTPRCSHQQEVTYAPLWGGKILFLAGNMVGENSAAYWFQQGKIPDRLLKQTLSQLPQNVSQLVAQAAQEAPRDAVNSSVRIMSGCWRRFSCSSSGKRSRSKSSSGLDPV